VSPSLTVSSSAEESFTVSLVPSFSQSALSTLIDSTTWIETTSYITSVIDLGNGETTITQIPTVTMTASMTEVWTVIWVESAVYVETHIGVIIIREFVIPVFVTSIMKMTFIVGRQTTIPQTGVTNATIIGTVTGGILLLFVFITLIIWFRRRDQHLSSDEWGIDPEEVDNGISRRITWDIEREGDPENHSESTFTHDQIDPTDNQFENELNIEDIFILDHDEWE
jgi:LPXTG-motif cell wall-anchored protein